ncbi:MAG: hypothetical protein RIT01_555 [Pseudomonadota bacterium]
MSFKCGIVGLPNVGKSTLFNALTKSKNAQAANFPFCTIEPNIGVVTVPDERLEKLSNIAKSEKIIPTYITFVDIAGLVAGASKGEGLGNKFLANIREVDAVIHMLRCFDSSEIQNVNKTVDPIRDLETVETEMMISDLESVEKRLSQKKNKNNELNKETFEILEHVYESLKKGTRPEKLEEKFDKKLVKNLGILSTKPRILVCNVDENSVSTGNNYSGKIKDKFKNDTVVIVSAEIEQQIGIKESGLDQIIKAGYKILNLSTYFTVGPKETHAWTVEKNCKAPDAAEVIHSDFKKGFIKAEVISYVDYIQYAGEVGARDNGKLKIEGKDYEVADGDILHFRFNT